MDCLSLLFTISLSFNNSFSFSDNFPLIQFFFCWFCDSFILWLYSKICWSRKSSDIVSMPLSGQQLMCRQWTDEISQHSLVSCRQKSRAWDPDSSSQKGMLWAQNIIIGARSSYSGDMVVSLEWKEGFLACFVKLSKILIESKDWHKTQNPYLLGKGLG